MALKKLGVPYVHMFSCDIDKNVKKQLLTNFPAKKWYDDLMTRDNEASSTPMVDLYVAGFPCQSFSGAGQRKGFKDKRGKVFYGCADYIDCQRPRAFMLENVRGLLTHEKGKTFEEVMRSLRSIGDDKVDGGAYEIDYKLMRSQEHGVPQSRPRVYIIGIRRDCKCCDFTFPEALPPVSLDSILDSRRSLPTMEDLPPKSNGTAYKNVRHVLRKLTAQNAAPLKNTYCIDVDASPRFLTLMKNRSPCMIKSRDQGFWITSRGRRMNLGEMLRCQGMERAFKQVVSDRALGGQIGNAMSQNILERLLVKLLPAAGLVKQSRRLHDRWAAAAHKQAAVAKSDEDFRKPPAIRKVQNGLRQGLGKHSASSSSGAPAKKRARLA